VDSGKLQKRQSVITPEQRRQVAAWLKPGRIFLSPFAEKGGKPKFFAVGVPFPEFRLIIINTDPRYMNPLCAECQVSMARQDYPFLDKQLHSYANCYNLIDSLDFRETTEHLIRNPGWRKGELNAASRASFCNALKKSDVIAPKVLEALLKGLA